MRTGIARRLVDGRLAELVPKIPPVRGSTIPPE